MEQQKHKYDQLEKQHREAEEKRASDKRENEAKVEAAMLRIKQLEEKVAAATGPSEEQTRSAVDAVLANRLPTIGSDIDKARAELAAATQSAQEAAKKMAPSEVEMISHSDFISLPPRVAYS